MLITVETRAAIRYSIASGNWNSTATWAATSGGSPGASFPVAGDVVYIESGDIVTVTTNSACTSVTFTGTGATLTVNSGFSLSVSGSLIVNSHVNQNYSNTLSGAGSLTASSLSVGSNITPTADRTTTLISTISSLSLTGDLALYSNDNGNSQNNAIFNHSSGTISIGGSITSTNEDAGQNSSTLTMATGSNNGILILGSATPFNLGAGTNIINLNGTASLVNYSGGNQAVYGTSYYGLTLSGTGTKTLQTGTTAINGSLTLNGSVTTTTVAVLTISNSLVVSAGTTINVAGFNLTVSGTSSISGTLNHTSTSGTKTFTGAVTINNGGTWNGSINESVNFGNNLTNNGIFTSGTGTHTFTGGSSTLGGVNVLSISNISISGSYTNTGALNVTGNITGAGTLINGANATITYAGSSITPTLTATASGNTVIYSGGAQTVKGTTYVNLTLSGSAAKTTSSVTVNGILSMEGTATVTTAPTYGSGAGLVYNTSSTRTAGSEWVTPFSALGGVAIENTGAITVNNDKSFSASVPLSIASGAVLHTGGYQMTFGGNFINNGGTFLAGTSNVIINNTMASQSISGFSTTGSVTVSKTLGTATLTGNVTAGGLVISGSGGTLNLGATLAHTINGNVTISGNTLNGGTSSQLSLTGNWNQSGGTFAASTGSVNFSGVSNQTIGGSASGIFNNLVINNASGIILSANLTVSGTLTLSNGIIESGASTITLTNNGSGALSGGSASSFIAGALIRSLASGQNYSFPIGKGTTYLPFGISSVTGSSPTMRVEVFLASTAGTAVSPLRSLSTTEYWQATLNSGSYSGGVVSLGRQVALNDLDAIGTNATTLNGSYTSLNGTVSGNSVINSDNTGASLGYFVLASKRSITTGTISPAIFCPGATVSVPFTITGSFNSGNIFTAQLSNASGSFASPVSIGTLASQTAGTINASIPGGQPEGTGYRIRVVSSTPSVTGSDNGSDITVVFPAITATYAGSHCGPGSITISASATPGATITWYSSLTGGTPLGTGTTFTTPLLSATATYYADATSGSCISTPRTPVLASIITSPTVIAGGGGTYCPGSTINLTSSGTNIGNLYWQGPNNFYSTEANPVITNATQVMSGTYSIIANALSGINLVTNGDFEAGNVGFTSDYIHSGSLYPEGTYAVVANPNSVHPNFVACTNHTPSGALQMVINGATIAGVDVWMQTVNVEPGVDYQFTYWIQSVVASNPSQLQLYANGSPVGPVYTALTPTCQWKQFLYNWNSGTATTATLSLVNQNTIASGNDFALDDIIFQAVCPAVSGKSPAGPLTGNNGDSPLATSVQVTVNAEVTPGSIGSSQSICRGFTPSPLTSVTAGTGSGTISYEWQTNATGSYVTIPGATNAGYSPPALLASTSYQRRTVSVSGGITCYSGYSTPVTITVSGPTSNAAGPNSVCQSSTPSAFALAGASVGGGATTGAWSIISGGGSLSSTAYTATPASVTYTPAAGYSGTVILRLTTNLVGGCTAISERTINVIAAAVASAGTSVVSCSNSGAVNITPGASASNYSAVTWTSGGTGSFTNQNSLTAATYTPSAADIAAGSVILTLTATGNSPCGNAVSTKTLSITLLPAATIAYTGNPFCSNSGPVSVTRTGSAGGSYSAVPSGLTINSGTGAITPATSTAGTYTVTYTIPASGGCSEVTASTQVTITPLPAASISYAGNPFCSTAPPATVTRTGTAGGSYSATPSGLALNSSSGLITPSSSSSGNYTITYSIAAAGGCPVVTATTGVTITTLPVASFNYSGSPFCQNAANPSPGFSGGGVAGTFSSSPGLVFTSTSTGQINLSASTPGTYTVTNTISPAGGCGQVVATSPITITQLPQAAISYSGSPFCPSISSPQPVTISGSGAYTGGTFSSSPGLSLDPSTGAVTPSASIPGSYTVTYTLAASGGCEIQETTTSVTVYPELTINDDAPSQMCQFNIQTVTASVTGGSGNYSYLWQIVTPGVQYLFVPGPLTNNFITLTSYLEPPGNYNYRLTVTDLTRGCSKTKDYSLAILSNVSVNWGAHPSSVCSGQSGVIYSVQNLSGSSYSWSVTGGSITAGQGTYQITVDWGSVSGTGNVTMTSITGSCTQTLSQDVTINATPAITLGVFPSVCQGAASAPLPYSSATGSPNRYSLDFDAAANSAGFTDVTNAVLPASPIMIAVPVSAPAAVYNAVLTVRNLFTSCVSTSYPLTVTVTAPSSATISYPGSPYCTSAGIIPVILSGTPGGSYSASPAGLSIDPVSGEVNSGSSTGGTYTVSYTMAANGGCPQVISTTGITITALPVATFSYAGSPYCPSSPNPLPTYYGGGAAGEFSSSAGLNFVSQFSGEINLATSAAGTYTVTNFIQANGGCSAVTASSPVTLLPPPPATPGAVSGTSGQCPTLPGQVYSVETVPNATYYNWTVPSGWTITAGTGTSSITVTTGTTGQNGNISVTAQNDCGTSASSTLPVIVQPGIPYAPGPISGIPAQCPGLTGQVYSIDPVPDATLYVWTIPPGWTITSSNGSTSITVTTGTTGQNGDITVYAGNSCGSGPLSTLPVTVGDPAPGPTGPISGIASQCPEMINQVYEVNPVPGAASYLWTVPAGWTVTSGDGTDSITVTTGTAGQDGSITVTAVNPCGSSPVTSLDVTVGAPAPSTPGAISGNQVQCSGQTGQIYSIIPVVNATSYSWTVPSGWSITSGTGTNAITVTTGMAGQDGDITVSALNGCGSSEASVLAVSIYQVEVLASSGLAQACYPTVKAAFDKINDGTHMGQVVVKVHGNTTETSTATLNGSASPSAYTQVTMFPTSTGISISGSLSAPVINLNGADNVTIDGRVNATGSQADMVIRNASSANTAGNSAIRFINNATLNTVRYCQLRSSEGSNSGAVIIFSTSSGGSGNSNNVIEYNLISSDLAARPVNGILSIGSPAWVNTGNIIRYNDFFDFFRPNTGSTGIFISSNSTENQIIGNSFYETTTFQPTSTISYYMIRINNTSGGGFVVSGNYLGGQGPMCSGGPFTKGNARTNPFYGIFINAGTAMSSEIDGNVIRNFDWTHTGATNWIGIQVNAGDVSVGSVTGNVIGTESGTGSILVTAGAAGANVYGINLNGTGSVTVRNNIIGGIITASTVSSSHHFYGIFKTATAGSLVIENNLVGSSTIAGSIVTGSISTASPQTITGISSSGTGSIFISGNTIANLTNNYQGTNDNARTAGIMVLNGSNSIISNTIHHLATSSGQINGGLPAALYGICLSSSTAGQTIRGNTLYELSATNPTARMDIYGIYYNGPSGGTNTVTNNYIHDMILMTTDYTADIDGILIDAGAVVCANNIVSLGESLTLGYMIYGISDWCYAASDNNRFYHNTVYITGTVASGITSNTHCMNRYNTTGISVYENNLLVNTRSGGTTGGHFAIGSTIAATTNLTCNYNNYWVSGAGGAVGNYGGTPIATLASWILTTGTDANSLSIDPQRSNPSGADPVDFKPLAMLPARTGTGITVDFGDATRRNPPTMGAWERIVLVRKWKGNISTDFAIGNNWTDGTVPAAGDDIYFEDDPDRHCILDGNRTVGNIINGQQTDRLITNGHRLTILGNFQFTSGAQVEAGSTGSEIVFAGSVPQSIPAGSLYNKEVFNLTVNNGQELQFSDTLRCLGTISTPSGWLDAQTGSPCLVFGGTSAQVIDPGTLSGGRAYNLMSTNPTGATLTGALEVMHDLTVSTSGKFVVWPGSALTVNGTINNYGGQAGFTIMSSASGTGTLLHGNNGVPGTVERYVSGTQESWHFLSSPVADQDISGSWLPAGTYGNGTGYDLYIWDEPSSCWIYKLNLTSPVNWPGIHPQSYFIPGKGYLYSFQEPNPTKEFKGNINNGSYSFPLTNSGLLPEYLGFNLLGNPYPSSVDWKSSTGWDRGTLTTSGGGYDMWVWNPAANNYGVYNSATPGDGGTNGVSRYLPPMQGFFVKAASNGNLLINNDARTHSGSANWMKAAVEEPYSFCLRVLSTNRMGFDEILLNFGYPVEEDGAGKLFSKVPGAPSLFMSTASGDCSVRYFTDPEKQQAVPVSFKPGVEGTFRLETKFLKENFRVVMLEDRQRGYIQDLHKKPDYTFESSPGDEASRFLLHFGSAGSPMNHEIPARIFTTDQGLVVDLTLVGSTTRISVTDLTGKVILGGEYTGKEAHSFRIDIPPQVLIVNCWNADGNRTRKVIWKAGL